MVLGDDIIKTLKYLIYHHPQETETIYYYIIVIGIYFLKFILGAFILRREESQIFIGFISNKIITIIKIEKKNKNQQQLISKVFLRLSVIITYQEIEQSNNIKYFNLQKISMNKNMMRMIISYLKGYAIFFNIKNRKLKFSQF